MGALFQKPKGPKVIRLQIPNAASLIGGYGAESPPRNANV